MKKNKLSRSEAKKLVDAYDVQQMTPPSEIPDGAAVRLNVKRILALKTGKSAAYVEFVKKHSGQIFHVSRDDPKAGAQIVVLEEDESPVRWLWHCSDLILAEEAHND